MMHVVITYGPRVRQMVEAEIEARLRILDAFDGATALQDLEPGLVEDNGDAELEGEALTH